MPWHGVNATLSTATQLVASGESGGEPAPAFVPLRMRCGRSRNRTVRWRWNQSRRRPFNISWDLPASEEACWHTENSPDPLHACAPGGLIGRYCLGFLEASKSGFAGGPSSRRRVPGGNVAWNTRPESAPYHSAAVGRAPAAPAALASSSSHRPRIAGSMSVSGLSSPGFASSRAVSTRNTARASLYPSRSKSG